MKQKSLIYSSGVVDVVEYPAVVISGDVLAKTLFVYIGDLEKAVFSGLVPLTRPLVPGSSGVVRVIEVLSGRTEYTGKYYTVSPLGERELLGVNVNGLLSNYVSLDDSYLEEELTSPQPQDALRPLLNHVMHLASKCEEPVLVEGCGLIGVALGALLREMGFESQLYCESGKRNAVLLDLNVTTHISNLSKKWRTLVITSSSVSSKYRVLRELEYSNLVISALSLTEWIPTRRDYSVRVSVVSRGDFRDSVGGLEGKSKKVLHRVHGLVKVVRVSDIDSVKGLLPPRGLGTIIVLD